MTMLAGLKGYYDRLAEDEDSGIAPYGYSEEKISFALVLSRDGELLQVLDLRDTSTRKPTPRTMQVPRAVKRTVAIAPNFLWDKASYVLGIADPPKDRTEEAHRRRLADEHCAFTDLHAGVLAGSEDEGLRALLAFLGRWTPDQIDTLDHKDDLRQNPNLVFRLDGEHRFLHQRPAGRELWAGLLAETGGTEGLCLISGERGPLARLHPSIKGVRGGQSSGASLVSFNRDAFASYGKEQGANAPVSEAAAAAYTTALNHLLRQDSRNRVQIADTSIVFWAESAAPAEEILMAAFFAPPATDEAEADEGAAGGSRIDPGEAAKVRGILTQIVKGRPLKEAAPDLREGTRFYVLGLAPNAARIAIRFWHEDTLGNLARRFGEHYRDLAIEPPPPRAALPAVWRLLYETAVQRKAENIPPNLSGEVMRAILSGQRYPRALLAAVIIRMRTDGTINGLRAALCKACLNRDARLSGRKEDVPVSLDKSDPNPGYRLGRLFAVLEAAQLAALGNLNATIRDRYYGAAAATPTAVFPLLMKNYKNHLKNVRTKKGERLANWYEKRVGEIVDGLAGVFPRSLALEDQGRFAIGYYHEREGVYRKKDPEAPEELRDADLSETAEDQED
jgi:CRISPR-associated protein Csd1